MTDLNVVTDREKMLVSVSRRSAPVSLRRSPRRCLYLISDAAKYVTGSDITVDGGQLLPSAVDIPLF